MPQAKQDVSVLFIMGPARSGSTLLAMLLGEIEGFVNVGELLALGKGRPAEWCGCGKVFTECAFWAPLLHGDEDIASLLEGLMSGYPPVLGDLRFRDLRSILRRHRARTSEWPDLDAQLRLMGSLYREVAQRAGARVVIDNAKNPVSAALLALIPGISAHVVELVRDPRAIAHSMLRRTKERPLGGGRMRSEPVTRSSKMCLLTAGAGALVRRAYGRERSRLLRYEDLIRNPGLALKTVTELVGGAASSLPLPDEHIARLTPQHSVGGNPIRSSVGNIALVERKEWPTGLSAWERIVVSLLTLPVLLRYGYVSPRVHERTTSGPNPEPAGGPSPRF